MRDLPNTTGPVSYGETSWETGDTPEAFTGKTYAQELIAQANTIPLVTIFKHYNIRIDAAHNMIVCPFKSHKGGRENTGSFKYYAETNSFYCHGCKVGGSWAHACEFVARMEETTRYKAACKIMKLFGDDVDAESMDEMREEREDFAIKFEMMMEFSNAVREFRQSHFDEKAAQHIEHVCSVYDTMNFRHKLTKEAMRRIVDELKEEIRQYK